MTENKNNDNWNIDTDFWNIDTDFWTDDKKEDDKKESCDLKVKKERRKSICFERETKQIYRRAFSETQLLDIIPKEFKKGYSYNFITGGDVDALSFLKIILRQQNLDYLLFSTWCMACDDILQIEEWLKAGKLKKIDAYVGEIFPSSYKQEYIKLKEIINKDVGRICVFKNHSKIFAGIGNKFSFGIQTSANINTNPRTENACITIDDEIYKFYKDFFDGIKSFK